jgi:CheY-like chemotaxis protein
MSPHREIILLVEDDEDDQFFMRDALKRADIRDPLQVVNNGRDAVAYLTGDGRFADRQAYPLPSVVFLDLKMPLMDGFAVMEWIRARREFADLVIIVLTSSPEERDHTRAYQLGARSYLLKPPTRETLTDVWRTLALRVVHRRSE